MTDRLFMKKRQRSRSRDFFTLKNIFRIMLVSLLVFAGFMYFVQDPTTALCEGGCESQYSLASQILGFFFMFAAIILVAGLVGALFAYLRHSRASSIYTETIASEDEAKDA